MNHRPRLTYLSLILKLIRLIYRRPALLLIGGCLWFYQTHITSPNLLFQGEPQTSNWQNPDTWFRTLRNHGFILGYSDLRGNPLWVEYALTPIPDNSANLQRPNHFSTDWRSFNRISHESYSKSGYDRGHMAPNYAISHLYGKLGQADSFLLTNISPQKKNLNQKLWERLENIESKNFAPTFGKVWVICGPIFNGSIERLSSDWKVEIPDAFFKIYVTDTWPPQQPHSIAFIIPQNVGGKEPLNEFITTIDSIEKQTGLDFFADLDNLVEDNLEATINTKPWGF